MQPKKIAEFLRTCAEDKKAEDPILLDISKHSSLSHYFLICHGNSDRHVKSIAMHLMDEMKQRKMQAFKDEGLVEWRERDGLGQAVVGLNEDQLGAQRRPVGG